MTPREAVLTVGPDVSLRPSGFGRREPGRGLRRECIGQGL
jgi:hypothetical protein